MASMCFVTPELFPFLSFSETALEIWARATAAARAGDAVTILVVPTGQEDWKPARELCAAAGMDLTVATAAGPYRARDEIFGRDPALLALPALRHLHRERAFARIEVPVGDGFALRIVQAALAGPEFDGTELVLRLGAIGEWKRHRQRRLAVSRDEIKADFAEREAVESFPVVAASSPRVVDFARTLGWRVDHVGIGGFPDWPAATGPKNPAPAVPCFLGEVAEELDPLLRFLAARPVATRCLAAFATRLDDTARNRLQATVRRTGSSVEVLAPRRWDLLPAVLREKGAVVVHGAGMAGFRLRWLAAERIGFVWDHETAGDLAGLQKFPELTFEAGQPASLAAALTAAAQFPRWPDVFAAVSTGPARTPLRPPARPVRVRPAAPPRVLLTVSHYNIGPLLGETLEALAAQDYPACDVLVVDDGSPDAEALAAFRRLSREFPAFTFVELPHAGYWSPRNHAIRTCTAPYIIIVDGDNLPVPQMASRFVEAMERNPDVAAFSSYVTAFRETREAARAGRFDGTHTPLGGDIVSGHFENIYGDTNSIFRIAAIRAIGGFREDFPCSFGDWEIFHRLVGAGHRLGVIPDVLLHYRRRSGGMIRQSPLYPNFCELLRVLTPGTALREADRRRINHALHGLALPR
jgi:hypothetical protein